jgi:hypothetical protein
MSGAVHHAASEVLENMSKSVRGHGHIVPTIKKKTAMGGNKDLGKWAWYPSRGLPFAPGAADSSPAIRFVFASKICLTD